VRAAIAREGRGALVVLGAEPGMDTLLARLREPHSEPATPAPRGALADWRRNGAGSQILADLGFGKLRVIGTPRRQVGLGGFGLEVVEYLELPPR
jgi:3,4-dihydroxy 2-butanone 4-phosphate synthase/GTP cyclohydrolase II